MLKITPEPSEPEREAIAAALEVEQAERADSPWPQTLLPSRGDEPDEPAP